MLSASHIFQIEVKRISKQCIIPGPVLLDGIPEETWTLRTINQLSWFLPNNEKNIPIPARIQEQVDNFLSTFIPSQWQLGWLHAICIHTVARLMASNNEKLYYGPGCNNLPVITPPWASAPDSSANRVHLWFNTHEKNGSLHAHLNLPDKFYCQKIKSWTATLI